GGSLSGAIDGLAGNDTLNGTAIVDVTLTGSTANGYSGSSAAVTGGFIGINSITGNGAGTLTGENVASTWTLAASKTYNDGGVATLTFSGFGTAQGGSAADTFNVTAATTLNLKGGLGNDAFNVNAVLSGTVDGEGGTDTLAGSTSYVVSGANSGTASNVSGAFSNIENLTGTAGVDSFTFQNLGTLSGNVDGLGGADTVDLNAKVGAVSINLQ